MFFTTNMKFTLVRHRFTSDHVILIIELSLFLHTLWWLKKKKVLLF